MELLKARFPKFPPKLIDYYGTVVSLFLGTNTIEYPFPILRWEKNVFHQALFDFGMEEIMQMK